MACFHSNYFVRPIVRHCIFIFFHGMFIVFFLVNATLPCLSIRDVLLVGMQGWAMKSIFKQPEFVSNTFICILSPPNNGAKSWWHQDSGSVTVFYHRGFFLKKSWFKTQNIFKDAFRCCKIYKLRAMPRRKPHSNIIFCTAYLNDACDFAIFSRIFNFSQKSD